MRETLRDGELREMAEQASDDDEVLERLLAHLHPRVVHFLARRFEFDREAEELIQDLAQETLVRIALSIGECRAISDRQLVAWAFTIARNVSFDHLRRLRHEVAALRFVTDLERIAGRVSSSAWDLGGSPGNPADRLLYETLGAACDVLEASTIELLWARLTDGLAWDEVAERFGTSPQAAKRRYQRAQRRLRSEVSRRLRSLPEPERADLERRLGLRS